MAELLKAEQQAKAHMEAVSALLAIFFGQLANKEMPLEEWERVMKELETARALTTGRYDALRTLRLNLDNTATLDREYARMSSAWYKYYCLARGIAA